MKASITIDGIHVDYNLRIVKTPNGTYKPEKKVFDLINLFVSNPNILISREEIEKVVWGELGYVDRRTVNICIHKVRDVLGRDKIVTHIGVGYRFQVGDDSFVSFSSYNDKVLKIKEVSRVEVIDKGRAYVNNSCNVELSIQDEGRTMKLFISGSSEPKTKSWDEIFSSFHGGFASDLMSWLKQNFKEPIKL